VKILIYTPCQSSVETLNVYITIWQIHSNFIRISQILWKI